MGAALRFPDRTRMASPWRRRRLCVLIADTPAPAALREVSGRGAIVETRRALAIGSLVQLHHPEAGTIAARVSGHEPGGLRLAFDGDDKAIAFALAAITADMTQAG